MANIMRNINVIYRCENMYRAQKSSENLPGIYHSYIFVICKNPGLSQDKLAKKLCVNKSNVTRHLAFLESGGYIERRPGTDKREMLIYPTDKIKAIYPEIQGISSEWRNLLLQAVDSEELCAFENTLQKLAAKAAEIIYSTEDKQ